MKRSLSAPDFWLKPLGSPHAAHQRHINHHTSGRSDLHRSLTEISHMACPKDLIGNLLKLGMDMGMVTQLFLFSTISVKKLYVLVHLKTQHISCVIDTIMYTAHHRHKPNRKLSADWGKITVSQGKTEETATSQSLCMQFRRKHLSFLSGGKGCSLSVISCSTWRGENTRTDTRNWDEFSIFFTVHLISNQVNLIWCQKRTWLHLLLKSSIPKWGRKLL